MRCCWFSVSIFCAGVCDGSSVTVRDSRVPPRIDGRIDADGAVWRWALHVHCEEGWALQLMLKAEVRCDCATS